MNVRESGSHEPSNASRSGRGIDGGFAWVGGLPAEWDALKKSLYGACAGLPSEAPPLCESSPGLRTFARPHAPSRPMAKQAA